MLNYTKLRFTTWLKMCTDDKTELVLIRYYKLKEHELKLYACRESRKDLVHCVHFILWDNDDAYYYSSLESARQAFESMNKLYYHSEKCEEELGEWTHRHICGHWTYQCSDCLKYHGDDSRYCQNCGKKMIRGIAND